MEELMTRTTISDMGLGQMLLGVMTSFKQSLGDDWQRYYEENVDIRYRQIIQYNFGFF